MNNSFLDKNEYLKNKNIFIELVKRSKKIFFKFVDKRVDKQAELYKNEFLEYFNKYPKKDVFFDFYYISYYDIPTKRSVLISAKILYEPLIEEDNWKKKISFYDYFLIRFKRYLDDELNETEFLKRIVNKLKWLYSIVEWKEYDFIEYLSCFFRIWYFFWSKERKEKNFDNNKKEVKEIWIKNKNLKRCTEGLCDEFITAYDIYNVFWNIFPDDYLLFYFGFLYFVYLLFINWNDYKDLFEKLWLSIENLISYLIEECISWCGKFSLIDKYLPDRFSEETVKYLIKFLEKDNFVSKLINLNFGLYINKVRNWYEKLEEMQVRIERKSEEYKKFNLFCRICKIMKKDCVEEWEDEKNIEKLCLTELWNFFNKEILNTEQIRNIFHLPLRLVNNKKSLTEDLSKKIFPENKYAHYTVGKFLKGFIITFFIKLDNFLRYMNLEEYKKFKIENFLNLYCDFKNKNIKGILEDILKQYVIPNIYKKPIIYLKHSKKWFKNTFCLKEISENKNLKVSDLIKQWDKVIIFHWYSKKGNNYSYDFLKENLKKWEIVVHHFNTDILGKSKIAAISEIEEVEVFDKRDSFFKEYRRKLEECRKYNLKYDIIIDIEKEIEDLLDELRKKERLNNNKDKKKDIIKNDIIKLVNKVKDYIIKVQRQLSIFTEINDIVNEIDNILKENLLLDKVEEKIEELNEKFKSLKEINEKEINELVENFIKAHENADGWLIAIATIKEVFDNIDWIIEFRMGKEWNRHFAEDGLILWDFIMKLLDKNLFDKKRWYCKNDPELKEEIIKLLKIILEYKSI